MKNSNAIDNSLPKAIFVGNGIHRVNKANSLSWADLLAQLKLISGNEKINLDNPWKPFRFAFEEFNNRDHEDSEQSIRILKQEIHKLFSTQMEEERSPFNEFH